MTSSLIPRLLVVFTRQLEILPFNTVSNGPKKCGCNNEVTLLTKVFLKENAHGRFCRVTEKRWP